MTDYKIRDVKMADAPRLLEIYDYYVRETAITFEYETPSLEEFEGRIHKTLEKFPYLVIEDGAGKVVGYAYASTFKGRAAYDWSVETSIYLDPNARRSGYGTALYQELEGRLKEMGILNLNACIGLPRWSDDPHLSDASVRFHEAKGYSMVGTFHQCGYKFDTWYDMCWMEKFIGEHAVPQKEVSWPVYHFV